MASGILIWENIGYNEVDLYQTNCFHKTNQESVYDAKVHRIQATFIIYPTQNLFLWSQNILWSADEKNHLCIIVVQIEE